MMPYIPFHCSASNIFHCDLNQEHVTLSGKLEIISGVLLEQLYGQI